MGQKIYKPRVIMARVRYLIIVKQVLQFELFSLKVSIKAKKASFSGQLPVTSAIKGRNRSTSTFSTGLQRYNSEKYHKLLLHMPKVSKVHKVIEYSKNNSSFLLQIPNRAFVQNIFFSALKSIFAIRIFLLILQKVQKFVA